MTGRCNCHMTKGCYCFIDSSAYYKGSFDRNNRTNKPIATPNFKRQITSIRHCHVMCALLVDLYDWYSNLSEGNDALVNGKTLIISEKIT